MKATRRNLQLSLVCKQKARKGKGGADVGKLTLKIPEYWDKMTDERKIDCMDRAYEDALLQKEDKHRWAITVVNLISLGVEAAALWLKVLR